MFVDIPALELIGGTHAHSTHPEGSQFAIRKPKQHLFGADTDAGAGGCAEDAERCLGGAAETNSTFDVPDAHARDELVDFVVVEIGIQNESE